MKAIPEIIGFTRAGVPVYAIAGGAKYTGKDVKVKFGTLDVSGQGRSLEVSESADEVDVTTYGSVAKEFIVGLVERSGSLEVLDDDASSAVRTALAVGTANSLTWFPKGTASGLPQHSCALVNVTGNDKSYPYDDAVMMSIALRLSGPVVEGTAP